MIKGVPVTRAALVGALGWPVDEVAAVLAKARGAEYDAAGNIVAYGLSLRETPHVFRVEGRRLYTWCAFDTLMFPVLLGKTAHVVSRCGASGTVVSLSVRPDEMRDIEPAGRGDVATAARSSGRYPNVLLLSRALLRLCIRRSPLGRGAPEDGNPGYRPGIPRRHGTGSPLGTPARAKPIRRAPR